MQYAIDYVTHQPFNNSLQGIIPLLDNTLLVRLQKKLIARYHAKLQRAQIMKLG